MIDLSKFKVIHGSKVLMAVALVDYEPIDDADCESNTYLSFKMLTVLAVDTNGNLKAIRDEAWRFQFVPTIAGKE